MSDFQHHQGNTLLQASWSWWGLSKNILKVSPSLTYLLFKLMLLCFSQVPSLPCAASKETLPQNFTSEYNMEAAGRDTLKPACKKPTKVANMLCCHERDLIICFFICNSPYRWNKKVSSPKVLMKEEGKTQLEEYPSLQYYHDKSGKSRNQFDTLCTCPTSLTHHVSCH